MSAHCRSRMRWLNWSRSCAGWRAASRSWRMPSPLTNAAQPCVGIARQNWRRPRRAWPPSSNTRMARCRRDLWSSGVGHLPPRHLLRPRADQLLVDRGLAESRTRAQALILAGKVFSGERRIAKAGDALLPDTALEVRGQDHPWVSRGGVKLAHGLAHFGYDPTGRICLDVGASTGGFTDVLLAHGATKVHAVDVGHGQLAWKLRQDPRVVVHEKTNARYIDETVVSDPIGALVCDASFIGLARV